jgi:outer membrane lipoprotein-sorting protein
MKMENHRDFHHGDLLDRAVDAVLREPTPDDLPSDRLAQLAGLVRKSADQPYPINIITRIKNMRARTRIAVAATILIAFFGLMSWLLPDSGASVAFADVAEKIANVSSATWKSTTTISKLEHETVTMTSTEMFLAPSHQRTETIGFFGSPHIRIVDSQKNKAIWIYPDIKKATFQDLTNPQPAGLMREFEDLQKLVVVAKSGKGGKVVRLGVKTIDGVSAEGFRIREGNTETVIWADSKTLLPVRVEKRESSPDSREEYTVMSDFRVDVKLDKSLFSLDVPKGYTVGPVTGTLQMLPPKRKQGTIQTEPPKEKPGTLQPRVEGT